MSVDILVASATPIMPQQSAPTLELKQNAACREAEGRGRSLAAPIIDTQAANRKKDRSRDPVSYDADRLYVSIADRQADLDQ